MKNILNLSITRNLGIHSKLMLLFIFFALIFSILVGFFVYLNTDRAMTGLLRDFGLSMGRDMAARSQDKIFEENYYALNLLVEDTVKSYPQLSYLVVLDHNEKLLANSFQEGLPENFREINQILPGDEYSMVTLETEKGGLYDLAVPIFEGRAGTVRLGINRVLIEEATRTAVLNIAASSITVIILGVFLVNILVRHISGNVEKLRQATEFAAGGDFKKKITAESGDELGRLAESFNVMLRELDSYKERVNEYQQKLEKKEKMRLQLINRLIMTQENERKRISLELYDQVGQMLTSMLVGLKTIRDSESLEGARKTAEALREIGAETIEQVSSMAGELRPSTLDSLGLVPAVEKLLSDMFKDSGIETYLEAKELHKRRFPVALEVTVFRVIEEALLNALKHSHAARVVVKIEQPGSDRLMVQVIDDGEGFDVGKTFSSSIDNFLGLYGMEERIALVGGEIKFKSAPGSGTKVEAVVPLHEGLENNVEQTRPSR